ncbi:MAG TPA: hypothetical protein PLI20_11080, partial [Bacillota bacterium]|nr:hypothetical protein [Bacillota bacterium]
MTRGTAAAGGAQHLRLQSFALREFIIVEDKPSNHPPAGGIPIGLLSESNPAKPVRRVMPVASRGA